MPTIAANVTVAIEEHKVAGMSCVAACGPCGPVANGVPSTSSSANGACHKRKSCGGTPEDSYVTPGGNCTPAGDDKVTGDATACASPLIMTKKAKLAEPSLVASPAVAVPAVPAVPVCVVATSAASPTSPTSDDENKKKNDGEKVSVNRISDGSDSPKCKAIWGDDSGKKLSESEKSEQVAARRDALSNSGDASGVVVVAEQTVKAGPLAKACDTNGKDATAFRNYVNSARHKTTVEKFYRLNRQHQTYDFAKSMELKYSEQKLCRMGLWECLEYMDEFVDDSDPDTEFSQMQHALQTAEAIREKYPEPEYDWLCLVGLIHDLGKIIGHRQRLSEPQWCVVGDTFPLGCAFEKTNVFHEFFETNPDAKHPVYSTPNGIYEPNCGLNNVTMSYGHDEYLYQTCIRNGCKLPEAGLYIIRFHSFYPWHKHGGYRHLCNAKDMEMLRWVQEFQKFDLYSKAHQKFDPALLKQVYLPIIRKYFPEQLDW